MGLLDRERGEMYLLMILLVSPAFGRPSSDLADIGDQLESFISFSQETGKILDNSKLTEKVVESLQGAEKNLLEMMVDLKTLKYETELQIVGDYFREYNKAKSFVRETLQTFRKLADKTVTDVRDSKILLEDLDKNKVSLFLKISLGKMKDLMIETLETLSEANKEYKNAVETFNNLNSSIASKNKQLEKMLTKDSADHRAWVATVTEAVTKACNNQTENSFFEQLDQDIDRNCTAHVEAEIVDFEAELKNLKEITEKMLESGKYFDETIQEAIEILTREIKQISSRTEIAKDVGKNIEEYPTEYLREYQTIGTRIINGLDDLKNASDKFLAKNLKI